MKTFLISRETKNVNYYFSVFRIFIKITLKKASIFQMLCDLHCTFQSSAIPQPSHHKHPEVFHHHQIDVWNYEHLLYMS